MVRRGIFVTNKEDKLKFGGFYVKMTIVPIQSIQNPWNDLILRVVTYIRGHIVLPPGQRQGSHQEECLPSEQKLDRLG